MFFASINGSIPKPLKADFTTPGYLGVMGQKSGRIGGMPYVLGSSTRLVKSAPTAIKLPVVSLFHFDSVDGSGNFIDFAVARSVSSSAGVFSTVSPKFGAGSALLSAASSAAAFLVNSADLLLESWTIEAWIKSTNSNYNWLWYQLGDAGSRIAIQTTSDGKVHILDSLFNEIAALSFGPYPNGVWSHRAIVRNSTTIKTYADGIEQDSVSLMASELLYRSAGNMNIFIGNANGFTGNIDEYRVTNGFAIYTANFTPPVAPFPNP